MHIPKNSRGQLLIYRILGALCKMRNESFLCSLLEAKFSKSPIERGFEKEKRLKAILYSIFRDTLGLFRPSVSLSMLRMLNYSLIHKYEVIKMDKETFLPFAMEILYSDLSPEETADALAHIWSNTSEQSDVSTDIYEDTFYDVFHLHFTNHEIYEDFELQLFKQPVEDIWYDTNTPCAV